MKNNTIKKVIMTGVIALTPILGAGAAMASSSHTVTTKDTMYLISMNHGVSLQQLIQANPQVSKLNIIWPDLMLKFPTTVVNKPVTQPVAKPVTQPVAKPVTQPVAKPVTQPVAKPVTQPVAKPVTQPVAKPVTQPVAKPVTQPVAKPVTQPVAKPVTQPVAKPVTQPATAQKTTSGFEAEVINLVNQERAKAGLKPLTSNAKLAKMAMDKAVDMYNNNYFDHNSPTYGSPFDMMSKYGITYSTAGENIAKGQTSAQQVMTDWMNSPGHRANIMNGSFTTIGVAYFNGEWVQEFIG
jgi:uncharacterized YkwD family protein